MQDQIEAITHQRPQQITPLSGGMIGEVYLVTLPGNERLVAKVAADKLDIEGYMLRYLREHSHLPVPEVIHSDPKLLLMTYIEGDSHFDSRAQQHAAELVADLHNVRAPQYGLEQDTLIGPLHQPNPQMDSWIDFFREHRLRYMAQVAVEARRLPERTRDRVEKFAEKLEDYLHEPEHPSLIHGDMWTTNILAKNGRITGFIDPATYYGHAEIELAFSTLFGTFGRDFFQRYTQRRPLEPGFMETRRDIYNLYPLLVHVRIFGGSYVASVESILRRFGF